MTTVDSETRPFNDKRLPLGDFWGRPNAVSLPVFKILRIDELQDTYMPKPTEKVEQEVEVVVDKEEEDRRKKLLKDAKYVGETSLWDIEPHEIVDEETGEVIIQKVYVNKLTGLSQLEKPKCFLKQEEEREAEFDKIKKENERKKAKRESARGGLAARKRKLQKGRAAIAKQDEVERQAQEAANLEAMI